ncbi:anosmin-1 [Anopheles maculipalpis]|uniref:anosmin-1 n=1 Tax=Anopheles maculipalpis TaxID=1496333 RepID=UPI002159535E|nr:anosmin-1 [Anopheles maculipalpis]
MLQSKVNLLKLVIVQHFCFYVPLVVLGSSIVRMNDIDNLLTARCRSNCTYDQKCYNNCMINYLENSSYKKYGDCPPKPPTKLDSLCLNTCDGLDYKCPGVEKCCEHSCGHSCQSPYGLERVVGLPPVPMHVQLLEMRGSYRTAQIRWDMKVENEHSPTYYITESRFHIGTTYAEHKMENDWQPHELETFAQYDRGKELHYESEIKLKPGRWYQVRVAAVNGMGTRGYSTPSRPFQLSKMPKPPQPPKRLTVISLDLNENRTYTCRVSWDLPRSDLPVEKYKLSWSLFLNFTSNRSKTDNSSLFKEMATISAPTRRYDIHGLLPERYYYLQIQAISVYGKRRLKSAANHLLMNTSSIPTGPDKSPINLDNLLMGDAGYRRTKGQPSLKEGIHSSPGALATAGGSRSFANGLPSTGTIRYQFALRKSGLAVRLSWSERGYGRYRLHICRGNRECLTVARASTSPSNQWQDVVLRRNAYEFGKLEFNTRYTAGVRIGGHRRSTSGYDIVRSFITPKCEKFRNQELLPAECNV